MLLLAVSYEASAVDFQRSRIGFIFQVNWARPAFWYLELYGMTCTNVTFALSLFALTSIPLKLRVLARDGTTHKEKSVHPVNRDDIDVSL